MIPDFTRPVALFGGSFDPVHEGHLYVMREVQRDLPGTQMVFVPAFQSPGKPAPVAPAALRLRWLEALAASDGFSVWDTELKRGGTSYTVDTLSEAHRLGARREQLFWVLGADAYQQLARWKEPGTVRALCRFVVVDRPGHELRLEGDDLHLPVQPHPASSTALRAALGDKPPRLAGLPAVVKTELENLILLSQNPYARKKG